MDRIDGRVNRRISGQRFHISGSADVAVSPIALQYSHALVASLSSSLVSNGGRMVIQLGEEPHLGGRKLSTVFDWTILEQVVEVTTKGAIPGEPIKESPCIAVGFSDWKKRIPNSRSKLVQRAVDEGVLEIAQLPQRLHIGAVVRERQAFYGDILVTLGGGPGVERQIRLAAGRPSFSVRPRDAILPRPLDCHRRR